MIAISRDLREEREPQRRQVPLVVLRMLRETSTVLARVFFSVITCPHEIDKTVRKIIISMLDLFRVHVFVKLA